MLHFDNFSIVPLAITFLCSLIPSLLATQDGGWSSRRRLNVPMMMKAYSTTDIPRYVDQPTPRTEQVKKERHSEIEDIWTQSITLYYADNFIESIQRLESLRVKRTTYFLDHDSVAELPFAFNHAMLHLALYRHTKRKSHLLDADMDFNSAITRCPHFYPAYLGRAQVAVYQKDYINGRRRLNEVLEILQLRQESNENVLVYDEHAYKGSIFVPDILTDLALIEYRMGVMDVHCNSRLTVAGEILAQCKHKALSGGAGGTASVDLLSSFFERKRKDYQTQASYRFSTEDIKLISLSPDLLLRNDVNDIGIMRWLAVDDLLKTRFRSPHAHKRSSSGLTSAMMNQYQRRKAMRRRPDIFVQSPETSSREPLQVPLAPPQLPPPPPASSIAQIVNVPIADLEEQVDAASTSKTLRSLVKNRFKSMQFKRHK